jgi:hypothetical protein
VASKLKPWKKGKLMSRTERLALVNCVLAATMTYFLIIFYPSNSLRKSKLLPCTRLHGKGTYTHGNFFAVR